MPDDLDFENENENHDDRDAAGLTPAERRQLEKRAADAERKLAVHDAGLSALNDDQRAALFAVANNDLTADNLKAKAEALFGAPKEPDNTAPPEQQEQLTAEQRIADAGSGAAPPPPPVSKMLDLRQKVERVGPGGLAALQEQAIESIREAGLTFGQVDHDGTFAPLNF